MKFFPAWLVILVVTRDVLNVGAVILAWVVGKPMVVAPSMASKVNTVGQIVLAGVVLGAAGVECQHGCKCCLPDMPPWRF